MIDEYPTHARPGDAVNRVNEAKPARAVDFSNAAAQLRRPAVNRRREAPLR